MIDNIISIDLDIIFEDIYIFAGKVREVNIAKGEFQICTNHILAGSFKKY